MATPGKGTFGTKVLVHEGLGGARQFSVSQGSFAAFISALNPSAGFAIEFLGQTIISDEHFFRNKGDSRAGGVTCRTDKRAIRRVLRNFSTAPFGAVGSAFISLGVCVAIKWQALSSVFGIFSTPLRLVSKRAVTFMGVGVNAEVASESQVLGVCFCT